MPDSGSTKTERRLQPLFRKSSFFSYLALAATIVLAHVWLRSIPDRAALPAAAAAVRYVPLRLDPAGLSPLRLAGAWTVEVSDPRFGGISGLAVPSGRLLALSDSGVLVSLPRPGEAGSAHLRDLPGGPGSAAFKRMRDSEALLVEPERELLVAFENRHSLWRYRPGTGGGRQVLDLSGRGWKANAGVEAMVRDSFGLLLFTEGGRSLLRVGDAVEELPLLGAPGQIADAARVPDGRILLLVRRIGLAGVTNLVAELGVESGGYRVRPLARLPLGWRDNAEALAAEALPSGGTRLWLMTDNDFRPRKATLLVALDLP
jgi:hypothetical protein